MSQTIITPARQRQKDHGAQLRALRNQVGISVATLALILDIDKTALGRVEQGLDHVDRVDILSRGTARLNAMARTIARRGL